MNENKRGPCAPHTKLEPHPVQFVGRSGNVSSVLWRRAAGILAAADETLRQSCAMAAGRRFTGPGHCLNAVFHGKPQHTTPHHTMHIPTTSLVPRRCVSTMHRSTGMVTLRTCSAGLCLCIASVCHSIIAEGRAQVMIRPNSALRFSLGMVWYLGPGQASVLASVVHSTV